MLVRVTVYNNYIIVPITYRSIVINEPSIQLAMAALGRPVWCSLNALCRCIVMSNHLPRPHEASLVHYVTLSNIYYLLIVFLLGLGTLLHCLQEITTAGSRSMTISRGYR